MIIRSLTPTHGKVHLCFGLEIYDVSVNYDAYPTNPNANFGSTYLRQGKSYQEGLSEISGLCNRK
jgi:hypothetical protein